MPAAINRYMAIRINQYMAISMSTQSAALRVCMEQIKLATYSASNCVFHCRVSGGVGHTLIRRFGPEIILQKDHYVRNMTEGEPFTHHGP